MTQVRLQTVATAALAKAIKEECKVEDTGVSIKELLNEDTTGNDRTSGSGDIGNCSGQVQKEV